MNWTVDITAKAGRELSTVSEPDYSRVASKLRQLEFEPRPHGAVKVKGTHYYRLRSGDRRMIYQIDNQNRIV